MKTLYRLSVLSGCSLVLILAVWYSPSPFVDGPQPERTYGAPIGHEESRSPKWPALRKAHLEKEPECAVCGHKGSADNELNVHHVLPFHLNPDKELDPSNLVTLCREHHLTFGHLCEWKSWNKSVREDAAIWRKKIKDRP